VFKHAFEMSMNFDLQQALEDEWNSRLELTLSTSQPQKTIAAASASKERWWQIVVSATTSNKSFEVTISWDDSLLPSPFFWLVMDDEFLWEKLLFFANGTIKINDCLKVKELKFMKTN
jgi:hypothetical protein